VYQLANEQVLLDWLAHETDQNARFAMLDWMAIFAEEPLASAHRIPGLRKPIYLVVTPVRNVTLKFMLFEMFHGVHLIEFGELP
jgi:hypothetical protein